jgi:hypothetical protein
MTMKTIRGVLLSFSIAAALTVATFSSPAQAAGHNFCNRYANSAVNQQNRNLSHGCGYFGVRWHRAWNLHYNWCRGVAKWRARDERRLRNSRLGYCGA